MSELASVDVADDVFASVIVRNTEIVVTLEPSGRFAVQWIERANAQPSFATLSDALAYVVTLLRDDERDHG